MSYQTILEQVKHYVSALSSAPSVTKLPYHNATHTEGVVKAATRISNHYQLNDRDFFIVLAAAWFHDTGYYTGPPAGHEARGAELATAFLQKREFPADQTALSAEKKEETLAAIRNCILATKLPQTPKNQLEDIVCDADLFHLGTDDFSARNKLMRKEAELLAGKDIPKNEWRKGTIHLLQSFEYHTDYCRLLLDEEKQANLAGEMKKLHEEPEGQVQSEKAKGPVITGGPAITGENPEGEPAPGAASSPTAKPLQAPGKKKKRSERGVETIFRITSSNNQRLSTQADSKAHIMIQVNSIIISVLLSVLLRKVDEHRALAVPCFLLLAVNVVTIIYSVLATRPHIPPGTFKPEDVDNQKVNLLFFGNFYRMNLDEYSAGMLKLMDDSDFLYGSLIKDVYFQGIALGRKYRQLRISYNVFMYGLIGSVLAFAIAATLF